MEALEELKRQGIEAEEGNEKYSKDMSYIEGEIPRYVVFPKRTEDVVKTMKFCYENKIPIVARGSGSSLTGSSVGVKGCIVVDLSKMKKILEVSKEGRYAVVEPGIVLDELNERLKDYGLFYPPDPGSSYIASLGGTIATNAGGIRSVRYGPTKNWVMGLEVVIPPGKVVRTGSFTHKLSRGYDLTSLFVGSEGTLGIITKCIIRLEALQRGSYVILSTFRKARDAITAAIETYRSAASCDMLEFLDEPSMKYLERAGIKTEGGSCALIVRVGRKEDQEAAVKIIKKHSSALLASKGEKEAESIIRVRKRTYEFIKEDAERGKKEVIVEDYIVPIEKMQETIEEMQRYCRRKGIECIFFGHVGEGNIHPNIIVKKGDKGVGKVIEDLAMIAIRNKGSISGEHGIGIGKKKMMYEEFKAINSPATLELMKKIKSTIDPEWILNPGKMLDKG
ncbi:MAG: FAD-binding oxidoreductase [Candidatus Micrarchaeaceae archaeon]